MKLTNDPTSANIAGKGGGQSIGASLFGTLLRSFVLGGKSVFVSRQVWSVKSAFNFGN